MSLPTWGDAKSVWQQTSPVWKQHVNKADAEQVMDWPVSDDFHTKQGRSTGRIVIHPQLSIYLKRHWKFTWREQLHARIKPSANWSPAQQEWHHLQWAIQNGFHVPEPLAAGQMISSTGQLLSYLAIRELTGMLALHQAIPLASSIMPAATFSLWKQSVFEQCAAISRKLHQAGRYHKDLYLCHFYVTMPVANQSVPGPLAIIDLHRMGHHPLLGWRWQIKDLAQFLYSTWNVTGIAESDRSQFMHNYLQTDRLTEHEKSWWHLIQNKARRYARHNQLEIASPHTLGRAA
ncbi:MAG: lipopolysaccharide kinase [Planctomycetia bacterium]|nr:lipopolysaccharide kinase [Planctomycetia bacterium]